MNALMRENSEAFVTGNETIERSIASLREKMDRDHAALAANQTALAANQTALAANQAALNDRVHQNYTTLIEKINTVHHVLRDKIEESHAKIDAVSKDLGNKIDTLSTAFAELRGFHKTVLWVCGGIVTLVTVSLSVGKAVGWL